MRHHRHLCEEEKVVANDSFMNAKKVDVLVDGQCLLLVAEKEILTTTLLTHFTSRVIVPGAMGWA